MKNIVIANWKMQLGLTEAKNLAEEITNFDHKKEVVVCPSFASLVSIGHILKKNEIKLGAQDCFWESKGAYTGEVSVTELKQAGCEYVIVGHSERRQYLRESDEMVHLKAKAIVTAGLTPIICVGETFEQRQEGAKDYVLVNQTLKALEGISIAPEQKVIIAYEPVWVIGSGKAVTPDDAAGAAAVIHQTLHDIFPGDLVESNFRIIYGGSVDSHNARGFVDRKEISGFLIGGASLKPKEFVDIINNI